MPLTGRRTGRGWLLRIAWLRRLELRRLRLQEWLRAPSRRSLQRARFWRTPVSRFRGSQRSILSQVAIQVTGVFEPVSVFLRVITPARHRLASGRQGLAARQVAR